MLGDCVLKKVRFLICCIIMVFIISYIAITIVLSQYQKMVRVTLDNKVVGYFNTEQEFSDAFSQLKKELSAGYEVYDIYIDQEPKIETRYIKKSALENQNNYTQLRSFIKTEYTLFAVYINNDKIMEFVNYNDANKYYSDIKNSTVNINIELKELKENEKVNTTSIDKAEAIKVDMVSRYKPIEIPKVEVPIVIVPKTCYPTTTRYVSCEFGGYAGHEGIDLAGVINSPVYAYMSGKVIASNYMIGYGNCIIIQHNNGLKTRYAHLNKLLVRVGMNVSCGQNIGLMGSTGWSTGSHLHFEYIVNDKPINPRNYIF